ncbi:MAG: transglutaminase TgpA family protein [Bryobacteraceae bacterium]
MVRSAPGVERFFQLALLGLVASGFLAVVGSGRLDTPTTLLTATGLLLRAVLVTGILRVEIPDRLVTAATLGYMIFYLADYQFLSRDFLAATVHLVFFLAVMKILTARNGRDYLYTAAISMLELLAAALISVEWNFFVFLGLYLLFAVATLASGEIRRSTAQAGQIARTAARRRLSPRLAVLTSAVTLGVMLLTTGLFFLLPRTASVALSRLAARGYYLPGFSNQVTLGQIGEIKSRSTAVMHVRFYKDSRIQTRFRGAGLSEFDGIRWSNSTSFLETLPVTERRLILADDHQRRRIGDRVSYRVDLKALDTDVLFFAGVPEALMINASEVIRTPNDGYRLGLGAADSLRYDVHSFFEDHRTLPEEPYLSGSAMINLRRRNLQLPPALDPRIPALAKTMSAGQPNDEGVARAIENHLRRDYGYTLELPSKRSPDPLAEFLFVRRKGHCEYFASAMAIMLRTVNIPARLATGFQGGVFNPISELHVVRASDAHTWVEAYLPGRGWTMFDPTPPDPSTRTPGLWTKISFYLDAAETFWQEWVLSYDLGRQLVLADKMESTTRRFRWKWTDPITGLGEIWDTHAGPWINRNGAVLYVSIGVAALLFFLGPDLWRAIRLRTRVRRLRQGQASVDDATLLYERFLKLLEKRGHSKPAWFTPAEFVRTLRAPELASLAGRFTHAYQELRFGGRLEAAPRLSLLLEELEEQL